jgi:hypothetical protein
MFWKWPPKKAKLLSHRFVKIKEGSGFEIAHVQTSKPILPAKPGYAFEIITKKEPS